MSFAEVYASTPSSSHRAENRTDAALSPSLARLQQLLAGLKRKVVEARVARRQDLRLEAELQEVSALQTRLQSEVRGLLPHPTLLRPLLCHPL